jgi:hypothetical protein
MGTKVILAAGQSGSRYLSRWWIADRLAIGNSTAHQTAHFSEVLPPDLARVVAAWPTLPASVKAAILAAVEAAERDG